MSRYCATALQPGAWQQRLCLKKKEEKKRYKHKEKIQTHVMMTGRAWSDTATSQEQQGLPEARQGQGRNYSVSEGAWLCRHLDFGLSASRTVREYIFGISSYPVYGNFIIAALGSSYSKEPIFPPNKWLLSSKELPGGTSLAR